MKRSLRFLAFTALCAAATHFVFVPQEVVRTEEEMKQQAEKDFADEDYFAAKPVYSQLLSVYPDDPVLVEEYISGREFTVGIVAERAEP